MTQPNSLKRYYAAHSMERGVWMEEVHPDRPTEPGHYYRCEDVDATRPAAPDGSALREAAEGLLNACQEFFLVTVACHRCEGEGLLWADGKAHSALSGQPTMPCPDCGGKGEVPADSTVIDKAMLKLKAALTTAKAPAPEAVCETCGHHWNDWRHDPNAPGELDADCHPFKPKAAPQADSAVRVAVKRAVAVTLDHVMLYAPGTVGARVRADMEAMCFEAALRANLPADGGK